MTKREITATAPNGFLVSTGGLGAKRAVGAIRITDFSRMIGTTDAQRAVGDIWMVSVHKSLTNAVSGPNQTPEWNNCTRWAIAVDENDQPIGEWVPASK